MRVVSIGGGGTRAAVVAFCSIKKLVLDACYHFPVVVVALIFFLTGAIDYDLSCLFSLSILLLVGWQWGGGGSAHGFDVGNLFDKIGKLNHELNLWQALMLARLFERVLAGIRRRY